MEAPNFTEDSKLASAVIMAKGCFRHKEWAVKEAIEQLVGIFYDVKVDYTAENELRIEISSDHELLEMEGLMQISVLNVLQNICKDFSLKILNVENTFLPEYA